MWNKLKKDKKTQKTRFQSPYRDPQCSPEPNATGLIGEPNGYKSVGAFSIESYDSIHDESQI